MDASEFSLDKVLEEANQKMHELAPDSEVPVENAVEIDPDDKRYPVSVRTLVTLHAFSCACASILSGEVHPATALRALVGLGLQERELMQALDEIHPHIHDRFHS